MTSKLVFPVVSQVEVQNWQRMNGEQTWNLARRRGGWEETKDRPSPAGFSAFLLQTSAPLRLCGSLFLAVFMQLVNHRVVGCVCVPLQSPSPSEHSPPWHPLLADGIDALFADLPLSSHWLEANATGAGGSPDLAEDEPRTEMESPAETQSMGRNARTAKPGRI